MEDKPKKTTRREFLTGTGAFVAGGVAGSQISGKETVPAELPEKWDKEVDVIVIGTGTAIPAALYAHDAGCKVLMLEKASFFGGHTRASGGMLWIPHNYLMTAAGISDPREDSMIYLRRVAEGQSNDELIGAFVDNGNRMLEWLRDKADYNWAPLGWDPTEPESGSMQSSYNDYFPEWAGGKRRGHGLWAGGETGYKFRWAG